MSRYRIEFVPAAVRQLETITRKQQVRIASKIDALASDPRPPGCVKLRGSRDIYRIRVGDYRILYQVKDDILFVLVIKVGKREKIYKR
jgi:mRNA interferase RelE/StbE